MTLKEAEGWNQTEADWRFYLNHNPEHCLVACSEGQVLATVTAANYGNRVAWIGMMLVERSARRQGISSRLMREVIRSLEGCDAIKLDATPAGQKVYQNLGFLDEFEILRMGSQSASPRLAGCEADGRISCIHGSDIPQVMAMDRIVMGVDRPELIHYLLSNYPGESLCVRRGGKVSGFAILRKGSRFTHVGPVVCRTEADAVALIHKIRLEKKGDMIVDLLSDKTFLKRKLLESGFVVQRPFTRMHLKHNPHPGDPGMLCAIAGPELG